MKHFSWGRRWAEKAGVKAGTMEGILLVILGCAGCGEGRQNAQEALSFVSAYQFAPGFGIIAHSPHPVYVLENESGYSVSRDGVTVELVRGMLQNNETVAELRMLDYRKNRMENDVEASSRSFDMRCLGPGIPDMEYTAERMRTHSENHDAEDAGYREILAEFCTTSKKIDTEKGLAGYYFQIDGLNKNLESSWTQAKGYEQISDMEGAVRHEDRWMVPRAVPTGGKGLAVELYAFSENISGQLIPGRVNPLSSQKGEITLLGEDKKIYRQTRESLPTAMNREPEVEYRVNGSDGRIWYFDVSAELQRGSFQLSVPSVTIVSSEESGVIILPLAGEKAGKGGVSDREILFKGHGLEIMPVEATNGKRTFGLEMGVGDGEGTGESLSCRLELRAQAAKGNGQMEMVLCRVKTKGTSDQDEWLDVMPDKESVSDPDLGGRFIFNLPYEEGDDSITFQLWHPYYVWEQSFSMGISVPWSHV